MTDRRIVLRNHRRFAIGITLITIVLSAITWMRSHVVGDVALVLSTITTMLVWWSYGIAKELDG